MKQPRQRQYLFLFVSSEIFSDYQLISLNHKIIVNTFLLVVLAFHERYLKNAKKLNITFESEISITLSEHGMDIDVYLIFIVLL